MINIQYFKTPFGELILGSYENKLCLADWRYRKMRSQIDNRIQKGLNAEYIEQGSEIIEKAIIQFNEYFAGNRKTFSIPLLFVGTYFQKKVWQALTKIPYGKTETYLGLSKLLGNEKAVRAVATANGANSISVLVACHRIIGSNGKLIGYAGGLDVKKRLLNLEACNIDGQLKMF